MSKRTLLDLTQGILSGMDSDSINSIGDTVEATQVAEMIRRTYFELIDEMDLPVNKELVALESVSDTSRPTHLKIPDNVNRVEWIKYDNHLASTDPIHYSDVFRLEPYDFVTFCNGRSSLDVTSYQLVLYNTDVKIMVGKLLGPKYWTSFDDEYIVMDSYNSNVDSTLQQSKTMAEAWTRPNFTIGDTFIPDLPENLFPLLYAQAEAYCHAFFKQVLNPKAERSENRLRVRSQRNKWRQQRMTNEGPDYGRKYYKYRTNRYRDPFYPNP